MHSRSTTALASSANPANASANVTFTAMVTGTAPTGGVAFFGGSPRDYGYTPAPLGSNPDAGDPPSIRRSIIFNSEWTA
jgi:hypothetical protein